MSTLLEVRQALAPAKLNLFLHVLGRRPDGYHELETLFVLLDVGDRLDFRLRPDGEVLRTNHLAGVPPESDLVVRAARLLQAATGCRLGVDIHVHKRLPMGGGLGGGSSDAATVLLVLNRLWQLHLPRAELAALGLSLGADVPVFVEGQPAYARGVGERLEPVQAPLPAHYVVLVPPVQVPTASVFAHPELTRNTTPLTLFSLSQALGKSVLDELPGRNDLEAVVLAQQPPVAAARAALEQAAVQAGGNPRLVRMTGSGACVFACAQSATAARHTGTLAAASGAGEVVVAGSLPVHPLRHWSCPP